MSMKVMRVNLALIIILLLSVVDGKAQQIEISGIVSDSITGNFLSGAHVSIENTKSGAISDYKGEYFISLDPTEKITLKASYIGYETKYIRLNSAAPENIKADVSLSPKPFLADEAIITASRVEVSRNIIPMTVSLVNRESLENNASPNLLPIVSRQVPGVFVTERGITGFGVADGAAGRISIRGIGGSPNTQVLVLIDGHPQFMGLFGHPLPDSYAASDAEKVEVVRGPASILYGSNAMGGVINIITRQQSQDGLSIRGEAGYGSFNTLKVNVGAGLRIKKFQAFISYNKDKTDGHRENSDFNMDNLYSKLSFDLNSHFKIWTDVSLARYQSTNPGPINTEDTTYKFPTHYQAIERGFASAAIENNYKKVQGALKTYVNWGNHTLAYDDFESSDINYGLMLYQALKLFKGNNITAGFDYAHYGGYAFNNIEYDPVKFIDTAIFETGLYALVQQEFFKVMTVSAGIRYQYHEMFESTWIPQLGVSYSITENTSVRANVSKGYRSPTIRELFMFKPANSALDPESMWNYEAGAIQKLLGQKLSLDLTGFFARGKNLIETVGVFPDIQNQNTGSFTHYGIEFQGKYIIRKDLDLMLNYSWLHTDKPTIAAPEHQVYLQGNYMVKGFSFFLSTQYINQLVTLKEPLTTQSYLLLSARVSYTIKDYLTFYVDGNNLTDENYEINYGYPMPGISVMAGFVVNWKKRF